MGRWSKRLHNYCLHTLGKEMSTKSNLYTNWICIELMVRCLNYNQQNWQRMFTTNRWRKWKRNKLQIAYSILGTSIPNINIWKRRRRRRENSLPTESILYANTYDIIFQALVLGFYCQHSISGALMGMSDVLIENAQLNFPHATFRTNLQDIEKWKINKFNVDWHPFP